MPRASIDPSELAFAPAERRPLLAALTRRLLGGAPAPPLEIHRDDHMFRFLLEHHAGHRELALVDYFRSGWSVARVLRQILEWRFGNEQAGIRLLDFAAGFGRATRFYLNDLSPSQIWVSDLFPQALDFQERLLGVHGIGSATEPGQLTCGERFDAIVVSSLFSHLPRERFESWLARLAELVVPGGVLLVSVPDQAILPPDRVMTDGFCFQESSEIPELDPQSYGVAWVSEAFMERTVATATGGGGAWRRLPRALWSYQDLYVIAPDGALPGEPLALRREPLGALWGCSPGVDGRTLDVNGWAADLGGDRIERVEVSVEDRSAAHCMPSSVCEDVDRFLGRAVEQPVSWVCRLESSEPFPPEALLAVEAVSGNGERFLVHLGSVENTRLHLRYLNARAEARRLEETLGTERIQKDGVIHELETRLAAMEASRFWKLRQLWWQARRAVGLGKQLPGRPATRK